MAIARRAAGGPAGQAGRVLARGRGWSVADVICTSGPDDRPFEEQHTRFTVAVVVAGTFQYRSDGGRAVMTPGSLMLGSEGRCYECGHEHGRGDRCVSFWFTREYVERLAVDAGVRAPDAAFRAGRVPPLRATSRLVADTCAALAGAGAVSWEELGVSLAVQAMQLAAGTRDRAMASDAEARVTRAVRRIERDPSAGVTLDALSREAGLSLYHFLRTFERVTGVTPHQYVRRLRLRGAALRLAAEPARILDIALDSGFGDVSNFNRAFRSELGMSPRAYRARVVGAAGR